MVSHLELAVSQVSLVRQSVPRPPSAIIRLKNNNGILLERSCKYYIVHSEANLNMAHFYRKLAAKFCLFKQTCKYCYFDNIY